MRTLRQLLRVWRLVRRSASAGHPTPWNESDGEALRAWFGTPLGRKIRAQMRVSEAHANATAVLRQGQTEWACGYAAGLRAGFAWLQSLAAEAPPPEEVLGHSSDPGEAELLERNSP